MPELATDNLAFATDVYRQVATDDSSNLFYSPYSISLALATTYNGANGETAAQMAQALHFTLPVDRLNAAFELRRLGAIASRKNAVDDFGKCGEGIRALTRVAETRSGPTRRSRCSNRSSIRLSVGGSYGAGVRLVDFQ